MKRLLNSVLVALLLCAMFFVTAKVYGATSFSGTISSNTTWTKVNSLYALAGKVMMSWGKKTLKKD